MKKEYSSLLRLGKEIEREIKPRFAQIEATVEANQLKVLAAFRALKVREEHFQSSTGYGYHDVGRETLDALYARVFGGEEGLVRAQIVSGTHALALCYFGLLRPGDEVLFLGKPYASLETVIGSKKKGESSLWNWGIKAREVDFPRENREKRLPLDTLKQALSPQTRLISIQRSQGYGGQPGLCINEIAEIIQVAKSINRDLLCLVDNCYGEFVEKKEPLEVGADLIAGSLIKNPGGGIAPTGGYIVGKKTCISLISSCFNPGGKEVGASLGETNRLFYQGLFLAPHFVGEALKGAVFAAAFFSRLGFEVWPRPDAPRGDIVQAIKLETPENLLKFCRAIQQFSPVNAHVYPEPGELSGYPTKVIMAGGTFIQGASLELSADAPWVPPYTVYFQGGLSFAQAKHALLFAAQSLSREP